MKKQTTYNTFEERTNSDDCCYWCRQDKPRYEHQCLNCDVKYDLCFHCGDKLLCWYHQRIEDLSTDFGSLSWDCSECEAHEQMGCDSPWLADQFDLDTPYLLCTVCEKNTYRLCPHHPHRIKSKTKCRPCRLVEEFKQIHNQKSIT